ncbi:uncharacterized protein M6B38_414015 [Iris pallida]|uniref:HNH nuclease domain-containing protein n=1 Tax=Iris pallida TaxID=29817 RepID=A0AAX6FL53_IRIPA|nr:uncharacterized protein M6B38_414015 [Iris pallida]
MARITAHGGLRMLLNAERTPFPHDPKDPSTLKLGGGSSGGKKRFLVGSPSGGKRGVRVDGFGRVRSHRKSGGGLKIEEFMESDDEEEEEVEEESAGEFERDELSCYRGLVLDISYRPVNVVCWKRAICLEFMEKADVLEYYDQTVSSPQGSFYIPAVLRVPHLLQIVKRRRVKQSLSRKNIFYRDSYTCQYCSCKENLTIDHILPISRGGEWNWTNLVTACSRCNSRKGNKTIEEANMKLLKIPKAQKDFDILAIPLTTSAVKMLRARKGLPEEWLQYIGKPAP